MRRSEGDLTPSDELEAMTRRVHQLIDYVRDSENSHRTVRVHQLYALLPTRYKTRSVAFVGMEPKREFTHLQDSGEEFARLVPFGSEEAGREVGPCLFRIAKSAGLDVTHFFDFSDRVVSTPATRNRQHRRKEGAKPQPGCASIVTKEARHFFKKGQ